MRIASLRRKSNVKVRLKYIIFPKQKTKKQFFQLLHRLPNMQNPCVKQLTRDVLLLAFPVAFISNLRCSH